MQLIFMAETYGRFQVLKHIREYFVNTHSVDEPRLIVSTVSKPIPGRWAKNSRQMTEVTSECSVICTAAQARMFKLWCELSDIPLRPATSLEIDRVLKEREKLQKGLKYIAARKKIKFNIEKVV